MLSMSSLSELMWECCLAMLQPPMKRGIGDVGDLIFFD